MCLFKEINFTSHETYCFFLSLCLSQVSGESFGQKITLKGNNVSVKQIIKEFKKQTQYDFIGETKVITGSDKISVDLENANVDDAFRICFTSLGITYTIEGNIVVLMKENLKVKDLQLSEGTEIEVKGKVLDPSGKPLQGATITVEKSRIVTSSDENGEFVLKGMDHNAVITISYLGYKTQRLTVKENLGNIVLQLINTEISDVEVVLNTGYQELPKERATGSFGVVDAEQIDKPAINIAQRLIGTIGGVQANLDVNGNPSFEIRGQTSLYASASPLVVVDGFAIQGGFNSINPNDVETITVLKDAAAASIWGARAGNGVIVITTKKNKQKDAFSVDFQAFTRIGSKFDLDYVNPLASSSETIDYEMMAFNKWSARENNGAFQTNHSKQWSLGLVALSEHYLGYISENERNTILDRLRGLDNKQQIRDELLSNPVDQQYNLTVQSASERMRNVVSLLYTKSQSNFKETGSDKVLLNHRSSSNIFKWLDVNTSVMLQYNKNINNGVSLGDIQGLSPYDMLREEDGTLTNIHRYYWPIMERDVPMDIFPYADWTYSPISEIRNRDITTNQLNARLMGGIVIKPIEGLNIESSIQYENFNTFNRNLYNEGTFYVRNLVNTAATWDQATDKITPNLPKGGVLTQSRSKIEAYILRNQASYNKRFLDRHQINVVAGSELNNFVTEGFSHPTTYGYNNETLTIGNFPNGPGGNFAQIKNWLGNNQTFGYTNSFTYRTERFFSVYGNMAYTLDDKYTMSASARTDASNMITDDPAYRYAPLWSIGGRWHMGKESFIERIGWVDNLGLRITYGYNGNVDKSTAFMPLVSMNTTPNTYTNEITANVSSFGNPTLRWEKTGTWNLGIDYSVLGGRLFGKVDVYNKYGRDLIAQLSIPAINGTTSQKLNNAEMRNSGIEIELGTKLPLKNNDIVWSGNLVFSYNKNKVTKLFVANYAASSLYPGGTGAYVEGYDANSMWMFRYAGVHDTQPMIYGENDALYDFGAWTPGDGRDFMINAGTKVAPYTLGFINSFKLYDFNFSFIVTGKLGHVFRTLPFNYPPVWGDRLLPNNRLSRVLNGDPDKIVPLPQNDVEDRYYFWDRFHPYLDYNSASASHLRMQEVNLSYNLPTAKWSALKKTRIMVYAQGNDLFTVLFNDYKEDPEYRLGTMKPQTKFTLGIKTAF